MVLPASEVDSTSIAVTQLTVSASNFIIIQCHVKGIV